MSREQALERVRGYFDEGGFVADLGRRVAYKTESQNPERKAELRAYLTEEMEPFLSALGFTCRVLENPLEGGGPLLFAEREEDPALTTVFSYGHGDVVRGLEAHWHEGFSPWEVKRDGDRLYGRGTADNKGQHTVNLAALATVLAVRGRLGFNVKLLIETGEEVGSLGLREACEAHRDLLRADVFVASDGPRVSPQRPTLFLGARGVMNFDFDVTLREGGHHSGNWGGLLANPAIILAHALASITDAKGRILVPELRPNELPAAVRDALADIEIDAGPTAPQTDPDWGEPGFTAAEKVYGWNNFEILAFVAGNPENPVNAIPPYARATGQLRYVVGTDPEQLVPGLRGHLDANGFGQVQVAPAKRGFMRASRLDPDNDWVRWAVDSVARTAGRKPAILPNLGGGLPNDIFSELLGLPTIWVPHSYAACSQHAPNEHLLLPVAREGLELMTGLFWDLGEPGVPSPRE